MVLQKRYIHVKPFCHFVISKQHLQRLGAFAPGWRFGHKMSVQQLHIHISHTGVFVERAAGECR